MPRTRTSYTTPSYDLNDVKTEFNNVRRLSERGRITGSARRGYTQLGMSDADVIDAIQLLETGQFHKTMPSDSNANVMQDVYYSEWKGDEIYVKFVQNEGSFFLTLLSFKENENNANP